MIPRVATVLSSRDWESAFVGFARESAAVRLVLRAFEPSELEVRSAEVDVVVAGAETSWVTASAIAGWRRLGLRVVGIHPVGDRPGEHILERGGADAILPESTPPESVMAAIRALALDSRPRESDEQGLLVAVTGSRGAPGRTELALGLAWTLASTVSTVVVDADLDAPGLAIRLGLPMRPDLADAADAVRGEGRLAAETLHQRDGISFIVGNHRPGEPPLRRALVEEVIDAARSSFDVVVADLGPTGGDVSLLKRADAAFLVVASDPVGVVRAARACEEWAGPPPALVLNKVTRRNSREATSAARRWLGLEPAVVVFDDPRIAEAARSGRAPARSLRKNLERLGVGG